MAAVALWAGAAQAVDLNITASYSGAASGLDPVNIPGGNWGSYNLRLGNGATGIAVSISSGALYGANNNSQSLQINGTNNTITFDGPTTVVTDNSTKGWQPGAFKLDGTNNKMIVSGGAQFTAKGWDSFNGTNNQIIVTGAGSVATFSADSDGFGNQSASNITSSNTVTVSNGGAVYVGGNATCNLITNVAGTYSITVDGPRSVYGSTGFQYMASGALGGILHATNGGALEHYAGRTDFMLGDNPRVSSICIDGGVLSYKNVSGVNMNENVTGQASQFTWVGHNAFRLNNAAATDTGTYTLADNLGEKNYAGLEMINGTTSLVRDIIVDGAHGGSLLVDNTKATIHTLTMTDAALTNFVFHDPSLSNLNDTKVTTTDVLTLSGTLKADFTGGTYAEGWARKIFDGFASYSGDFSSVIATGLPDGLTAQYSAADQTLSLVAVPEPSTMALLATGLLGLLAYWRKRK